MKQPKGIKAFNSGKGGGKAPTKGVEHTAKVEAHRRAKRAARLARKPP